ncbi:hypothetical protein GWI33_014586 [Rhynchophorus ferrugineus]|uniref:Tudor domain-containing protein n=1 Tax=Rhynchophorus ferrugineus TaxID=354439 RepID=A0A834I4W1_RHYFE|nr:hypothetical protein GWI33_014586 [Rhynchophorus ferrugineus]
MINVLEYIAYQEQIPMSYCYDREAWEGDKDYRMIVTNVFSPSQFWVVSRIQQHDLFHRYMQYHYNMLEGDSFKLSCYSVPCTEFCVIKTNGSFYRAMLVSMDLDRRIVRVFLVDYGISTQVNTDNLYLLFKELRKVPMFAIRATLSDLGPYESSTWSPDAIEAFRKMVMNKALKCKLKYLDDLNAIVELDELDEYHDQTGERNLIKKTLIDKKFAEPLVDALEVHDLELRNHLFKQVEAGVDCDPDLSEKMLKDITASYPYIGEILINNVSIFGN